MSEKEFNPWKHPFQAMFRAGLLFLGAVLALHMAVAYLRPLLPWLLAAVALVALTWIGIAIIRWRRSQW